ncbi:hypothetical protein GM415_12475 [Pseudodesulfovibrio cashew]|uniref:Dinitrogenase iron-molybdenum cofactor biosynthesis domain-containing protein n=1 Tax=Pseudodesulfovibrio cashew TaxID=2678688 RepID=A0A6I6JIJ7_9BACT|nr:NifB/NifX family molybdenum-iron cluster-binding protein [Pseudodesulfovibrio cashew]QGY40910.1 hypothetical protein GM415_12475 [Pseudodesulfovibrio cashew]
MKIALPSNKPYLNGNVSNTLGAAVHLVVVESEDMSFEVLTPPSEKGPGAGIAVMSLAVEAGAKVMLAGHVAPHIAAGLEKLGIEVVTGVTGNVEQAVREYLEADPSQEQNKPESQEPPNRWPEAAKKGLRQFHALLPRLIGIILLLGLLKGFVSQEGMLSLFPDKPFLDALWGGVLGSILVGNPVNSYVIGESLLKAGVNLTGPLALMMAWVTVGLVQLPMEAESLGMRFAVVRNLIGFIMAVLLSFAMGSWMRGVL